MAYYNLLNLFQSKDAKGKKRMHSLEKKIKKKVLSYMIKVYHGLVGRRMYHSEEGEVP